MLTAVPTVYVPWPWIACAPSGGLAVAARKAVVDAAGSDDRANSACTTRSALIATEQVPVPVQSPPQPAKVQPLLAAAVTVTFPEAYPRMFETRGHAVSVAVAIGVAVGLTVIVPPALGMAVVTRTCCVVGTCVVVTKSARTARSPLIVTVQVPVPEQAPCQPAKR